MKRLLLLAFLLAGPTGCAVLSEDHRHALKALDDSVTIDSPGAMALMAPLAFPVATSAFVLDGFILNPLFAIPEAADDARWAFEEVPFLGPGELIAFPMRLLTTVCIFLGSGAARVCVPF